MGLKYVPNHVESKIYLQPRVLFAERNQSDSMTLLLACSNVIFENDHVPDAPTFVGRQVLKKADSNRSSGEAEFALVCFFAFTLLPPAAHSAPHTIVFQSFTGSVEIVTFRYIPGVEGFI
jgi:hypothetical protein